MNRRHFVAAVPAALWAGYSAASAPRPDGLKSGLPVGEFPPPFDVQDITGPNQGQSLCYR